MRRQTGPIEGLPTDHCIFEIKGHSLTTTGQVKEKCMLGPKADCDRCGCVVPYYLHYRVEKKTILEGTWREIQKHLQHSAESLVQPWS